jgi:hypothetical protein
MVGFGKVAELFYQGGLARVQANQPVKHIRLQGLDTQDFV